MKTKKRITAQERDLLALFKAEGLSNKECARRLFRHPSVIGRELKRNSFHAPDGNRYYVAIHAQARAKDREQSHHNLQSKPSHSPNYHRKPHQQHRIPALNPFLLNWRFCARPQQLKFSLRTILYHETEKKLRTSCKKGVG